MHSIEEIIAIENQYCGVKGQPLLGEACTLLQERWAAGYRDRETALHLLFLNWYALAEPHWFTGLDDNYNPTVINEIFIILGGEDCTDVEVCFILGIMAAIAPWILGDEVYWINLGSELKKRVRQLAPQGVSPSIFAGRGAYGEYFAHMATNGC